MPALAGRVAVITGAARGLGREHALLFASEAAQVVVNDVDAEAVEAVAAEIGAAGGEAAAVAGDAADWDVGRSLVEAAQEAFGRLDVLVNNAGILRDRFLVTMSEVEWDDVVRVHLKGTFVPMRWAAAHWREEAKAGRPVKASVVNTSSTSGLLGNPGQANYGAAKAGIAALTTIAASELGRYGVRCNAVVPMARTRLTEATPGLADVVKAPADPGDFDAWHPANVSPLVAALAAEGCALTGQVLLAHGDMVQRFEPWSLGETIRSDGRWTVTGLVSALEGWASRA
ncbi:MAG: SDR family NAD(P)-dependent oxidoreductase [Acidimicrobiales bacterium]